MNPHPLGRHVRGALTATQDGAQGDHQQFVQVVKTGIAGPRIRILGLGYRREMHADAPSMWGMSAKRIVLDPGQTSLASWRAIYRGAAVALETCPLRRHRTGRRCS